MEAETTFYPEESAMPNRDAVQKLKSKMTLDLFASSSSGSTGGPSVKKQAKLGGVLASPDLQMLKLASPELERMIIQQNGMVTTTPTPTQFLCPKFVTEEQEAYARGFVDALNELHKQQPPPPNAAPVSSSSTDLPFTSFTPATTAFPGSSSSSVASSHGFPTSTTSSLPSVTELTQAAPQPQSQTGAPSRLLQLKQEEPQTVPCLGSTPPISPINMESQEVIKLERKRARNRVAARKCRTRKLERISRLEDRVNELKSQNSDLTGTANSLRDQVCRLKQQIMEHVNSGCQVMLSQNLL